MYACPSSWKKNIIKLTAPWPTYIGGGAHAGIDIACGGNTTDRAIACEDAFILDIIEGSKSISGTVILDGLESGYQIKYKHQGDFQIKAGDTIEGGVVLSTPNRTNTDSLHIHFEVWDEDKNLDPLRYLLDTQPNLRFDWLSSDPESESNKTAKYYKKNYPEIYRELLDRRVG